jgi:hypothetical protein
VPNIAPSSLPGSEVLALEPMVVVKLALTNLTALIVVLYLIFQKPKNSQSPIVIASLSLGMVFGIGAFFSMRFFEYFVPATFIAFGFAISSLQPKTRWALLAFLVPLTIFPWWHFHDEIKSSRIRGLEMTRLSFDALSSLPSESQNRKIFNCSWGIGAYIIYARPKFRFVDAMDALPLFLLDERRYHLRHAIASAAVPDPYKELKEAFGANYIICNDSRSLTKLALNNPAFKLISAESNPIRVFVLKESPPSVFVKNLSIANLTNLPVGKYAKLSLSDFEQSTSINLTGTFLSLWHKDASAELTNCFKIRMNFDSHHIGAKKIYVRASQQYRIFRNGREIFSSPLIANLLPTPELIGLTPPLRPRDSLESIVCAKANYQLAGASFWFDTPNL